MTQKECVVRKEKQLRAVPGDALSVGQKEGKESAKGARKEHGGAGGKTGNADPSRNCGS